MNFSDRLNLLFEEIGCSNSDIAALASIHPSGISRFRSGNRIPTPRNNQIRSICIGIVSFSIANDRLSLLCKLSKIKDYTSEEDLTEKLLMWLLEDSFRFRTGSYVEGNSDFQETSAKFFADKLNAIMKQLSISNNSIATALHVHSSVISRYRNHIRIPSGIDTVRQISSFLYDTAEKNGQLSAFTNIAKLPDDYIQSREKSISYLSEWLLGAGEHSGFHMVSMFLNRIDKFKPETFPELPDLDIIAPQTIRDENVSFYKGIQGLRRAVVRFLGNAAKNKEPGSLLLYSDQPMDWMTEDSEYRKLWAALMVYTLRAKNRIRIIHNLDRSLEEIVPAIEGWLPLYMSGLIEAYLHKKEVGERYSHTIFISSSKEAIVANFPKGMDNEAEYMYETGNRIDYYTKQFEKLIDNSAPLMRMFVPGDTEGLMLLQRKLCEDSGDLYKMFSSPSFETMSEKTLVKILDRLELSDIDRAKVEEYYKMKRGFGELAFNSGMVYEYVCVRKADSYTPVPINIGSLFFEKDYYYTDEEYLEHLKDMQKLAAENQNYRYTIIDKSIFDNLQIVSKKNSGALTVKNGEGYQLSTYWHPIMANIFCNYLEELVNGNIDEIHGWE